MNGDAQYQELARRLIALEKRVNSSTPQLTRSSIEDGSIKEYDELGQLSGVIGRQWDKTHGFLTVSGPPPPKPAVGTVTQIGGGLRVRWAGDFDPAIIVDDDPLIADTVVTVPEDFARLEVHADTSSGFSALTFLTLRRSIESPRGGEVEFRLPQDTNFYLKFVIRTKAGKVTVSDAFGPFTAGKLAAGEVDVDFSAFGGTTVFYGASTPTASNYGDLWLKQVAAGPPPEYETYRWYPDNTWKLLADQGAVDALAAAVLAQQIAEEKAEVFYQDTEPTGLAVTDEAIWFDTNDGNRARSWNGTAFVDRLLGNGAIQPASLVASDLVATGTVTATLLEAILVLATEIIGGDPNGPHAKMSELGFELFNVNPEGVVQRAGGLGTGADGLNLVDIATGQTNISILPTGDAAVKTLTVTGLDLDGDDIPDGGANIYGRDFIDWMADKAGGIQSSAFYNNAGGGVFASGITSAFGLAEGSFIAKAGRAYLILFDGFHYSSTAAPARGVVHLRATTDGSSPTITTGTRLGSKMINMPTLNQSFSVGAILTVRTFSQTEDLEVRVVPIVQLLNGTGSLTVHTYADTENWNAPFQLVAIEIGRDVAETFILNDAGGTRTGYTTQPAPAAKKTYTSAWGASFVGTYRGDGTRRTDTSDMIQGFTSYYTAGGTHKSIVGFMGNAVQGETSKTIAQALSGATISKVEVYLHCNHSFSYAGGTGRIGYHGNTTLPGTAPSSAYEAFGSAFFQRGQGRWMTLPSSTHASWLNGTYRGITVGPGGDYMRFTGAGSARPAIRITYSR